MPLPSNDADAIAGFIVSYGLGLRPQDLVGK